MRSFTHDQQGKPIPKTFDLSSDTIWTHGHPKMSLTWFPCFEHVLEETDGFVYHAVVGRDIAGVADRHELFPHLVYTLCQAHATTQLVMGCLPNRRSVANPTVLWKQ